MKTLSFYLLFGLLSHRSLKNAAGDKDLLATEKRKQNALLFITSTEMVHVDMNYRCYFNHFRGLVKKYCKEFFIMNKTSLCALDPRYKVKCTLNPALSTSSPASLTAFTLSAPFRSELINLL